MQQVPIDATELASLRNQLLQAQKMEIAGTMASAFAHDFNNMLTVMLFCVEQVLLDLDDGLPVRDAIAQIRREAQRASLLVSRLHHFARPKPPEQKVLEIGVMLKEFGPSITQVLRSNISLVWILNDAPMYVRVDPVGVEMVLLNLVLNAGHAMPTGGRLEIRVFEDGGTACILVQDDGDGMAPDVAERAFDPFFTTKGELGTGMGLAMARSFLAQQGGSVSLTSIMRRGTDVKVCLPLVEAVQRNLPELEQARYRGDEVVMIVDDDAQVRRAIRETLTRFGYTVLEYANGTDALYALANREENVQVLVSDLIMPFTGGQELATEARRRYPHLKVILMSGHQRPDSPTAGDAFLAKPFLPHELAVTIRGVVDRP